MWIIFRSVSTVGCHKQDGHGELVEGALRRDRPEVGRVFEAGRIQGIRSFVHPVQRIKRGEPDETVAGETADLMVQGTNVG